MALVVNFHLITPAWNKADNEFGLFVVNRPDCEDDHLYAFCHTHSIDDIIPSANWDL